MRLLLDEDSGAHSLLKALRAVGHDVVRVVDVVDLGAGASDAAVYGHAVTDDRAILTGNGADFIAIASLPHSPEHPGILVIHYGDDGSALPVATIARAIGNIERTYATTHALILAVSQHIW